MKEPNQALEIKPLTTMRAQRNKASDHVIHLAKEIGDISKYKIVQENYSLHDDSNMIEATFFNELNKKFQIYGLISYLSDNKKNIAKLINPQNVSNLR